MSKNEFDELLLKKLQEEDLPYNPEHWDHLSQLLPPSLAPAVNRGRKWLIATGIAAAAAFILASVLYVKLMDKNQDAFPAQEPALAQKEQPEASQNPATLPLVTPSAQEQQHTTVPVPHNAQAPVTANNSSRPGQHTGTGTQTLPYSPGPVIPGENLREQPPRQETVVQEAPREEIVPQSPVPQPKENTSIAKSGEERSSQPVYTNNFDNGPAYVSAATKANRTSVSLGGGVNYGNLNAGYTVGVSARTKIAGNFFVDGTVAMMYNNNANNVANVNGASTMSAKGFAARPSGQLPASPAIEPTQSLYYVQVNPSIGYQIDKNVALSVGSDFQQMLSRTDGAEKVQLAADNTKIFPAFDVGLTTKSEFNITPNIQAGLMYREGLSNLLKNDGNKYVNRRYFQVQFKYNIPLTNR